MIAATLVVIALFGPVFTLIFAFIVRSAKRKGMRFGDGWEDLLLSRAAFKQLNRRLYLQGLFYFAIYFLMIMPVVLLVPAVRFGIPDLLKLIPNLDADVADRMDTLLKLMAAGMAAWIASGTIVRPLGILFVSCVDVPEPRFYEIEFGSLKDKIEDAFTEHGQGREKLVQELRQEWAYVMAELRKQELRVKHHSPERIPEMLLNRAQAAPAIAGFPVLFDSDPDPTMIRDYERIRHSEPVIVCWTVKYGDRRDVPQFSRA